MSRRVDPQLLHRWVVCNKKLLFELEVEVRLALALELELELDQEWELGFLVSGHDNKKTLYLHCLCH